MRKFLFAGIVGPLAVAAFVATTVLAGPGSHVAQADSAALVIDDSYCRLFDGDGRLVLTRESHGVVTQSKKDTTILKCSVKGLNNYMPERPRSWLSMRRDSCRSVPMTKRPPSSTT